MDIYVTIAHTFGSPDFCISEFYVPKALFVSNIIDAMQTIYELATRLDRKRINALTLYVHIPTGIIVILVRT